MAKTIVLPADNEQQSFTHPNSVTISWVVRTGANLKLILICRNSSLHGRGMAYNPSAGWLYRGWQFTWELSIQILLLDENMFLLLFWLILTLLNSYLKKLNSGDQNVQFYRIFKKFSSKTKMDMFEDQNGNQNDKAEKDEEQRW